MVKYAQKMSLWGAAMIWNRLGYSWRGSLPILRGIGALWMPCCPYKWKSVGWNLLCWVHAPVTSVSRHEVMWGVVKGERANTHGSNRFLSKLVQSQHYTKCSTYFFSILVIAYLIPFWWFLHFENWSKTRKCRKRNLTRQWILHFKPVCAHCRTF